jgi:transcriptional regulator with XRE-family HTH domain
MKEQLKKEAIKLRKDYGLSYKQIAEKLNVSKSSLSIWLRNVELSKEQKDLLLLRNPIYNNALNGSKNRYSQYLKIRQQYQENGRKKAHEGNLLHLQGCMLYWAEGAKSRNDLSFANSDVNMHKLFIKFLRQCFNLTNDKILIRINCYNDIHSQGEIENYWLSELDLPISSLRKTTINNTPISSKNKKKNKLEYGVCTIKVHSSEVLQHIYGAIQEYAGFNNDDWLK